MRLFGKSSELQLEKDVSSRYLPIVISSMIFLAALSLGGMFSLSSAMTDWSSKLSGNLTIEIAWEAGANLDKRSQKALKLVKQVPGVLKARAIPLNETVSLLEPWLGTGNIIAELPLPRLIEVTLESSGGVNLPALATKLEQAVPGASLDTHRPWLDKMVTLARSVQLLAGAIMILIVMVTVIIVIFATRTGLIMHEEVIEVLHLIGAKDSYIALQFQNYFGRLSFLGALPGLFLAVFVMISVSLLAGRLQSDMLPTLTLSLEGWITLAMLPVLVALLTIITVRLIVLGSLKRKM
jgi:cell division transport system permease protein